MINILFPLKLHLTILQLEEYKSDRFLLWNLKNFFKRKVPTKKDLIYTPKIKNIIIIYFLLCILAIFLNFFLFLLFLLEPFIPLTFANLIIKPYELYKKQSVINKTRKKILSLQNLKVIGITGSYGKTSTKEILYQILRNKFKVMKTPESFNTVFGIAKVVDYELDNSYDFFICEMAAYKKREIKNLCYMVPPNYGILTGITTQHFERFGSLKNTIKAKFELVEAIHDKNNIVFNTEDQNILSELRTRNISLNTLTLQISNINFTKHGSSFDLIFKKRIYKVKTPLFGFSNIKNIILASEMSMKLGLNLKEISTSISSLKPANNRMALISDDMTTIVNNTYSSNVQSFREIVETAKLIPGKKVLVTPGVVELGNLEIVVHENLGKLSQGVFDKVILVGRNQRTTALANGLEKNYEYIEDTRNNYFEKIEELKNKFNWIFLENDLTQNY